MNLSPTALPTNHTSSSSSMQREEEPTNKKMPPAAAVRVDQFIARSRAERTSQPPVFFTAHDLEDRESSAEEVPVLKRVLTKMTSSSDLSQQTQATASSSVGGHEEEEEEEQHDDSFVLHPTDSHARTVRFSPDDPEVFYFERPSLSERRNLYYSPLELYDMKEDYAFERDYLGHDISSLGEEEEEEQPISIVSTQQEHIATECA